MRRRKWVEPKQAVACFADCEPAEELPKRFVIGERMARVRFVGEAPWGSCPASEWVDRQIIAGRAVESQMKGTFDRDPFHRESLSEFPLTMRLFWEFGEGSEDQHKEWLGLVLELLGPHTGEGLPRRWIAHKLDGKMKVGNIRLALWKGMQLGWIIESKSNRHSWVYVLSAQGKEALERWNARRNP